MAVQSVSQLTHFWRVQRTDDMDQQEYREHSWLQRHGIWSISDCRLKMLLTHRYQCIIHLASVTWIFALCYCSTNAVISTPGFTQAVFYIANWLINFSSPHKQRINACGSDKLNNFRNCRDVNHDNRKHVNKQKIKLKRLITIWLHSCSNFTFGTMLMLCRIRIGYCIPEEFVQFTLPNEKKVTQRFWDNGIFWVLEVMPMTCNATLAVEKRMLI